MPRATILIADDDARTRATLGSLLAEEGYSVIQAEDGLETLKKLQLAGVDLALLDLKMPPPDGLAVLRILQERAARPPVIVLSAYGTIQTAVEAMKLGAYDFLEKPLRADHVALTVRRALEHARLRQEHARMLSTLREQVTLIGQHPNMRQVHDLITRVAGTSATVLIQGERGTGKELVARAVHLASPRAAQPYVVVNCAAMPGELIESELFGHVKGAFTSAARDRMGKFQMADQGTLFLDEIGDMSLAAQAKVLRALESGEIEPLGQDRPVTVSVRVLAATHKDLAKEIAAGRFREDLHDRLNVIAIHLPPLRERKTDIPTLTRHFLDGFCDEQGLPRKTVSSEALQALMARDWPGNVRELKHAMQKLAVLVDGTEITAGHIGMALDGAGEPASLTTLREARQAFEREFIVLCLAACGWDMEKTARALDLEYTYLYKKIKALGIPLRAEG
jgi:two-component system nitrogen regulation response regulator NtrX